ncbi:GNAT family protein [Massilia sp. W12]|uniref:GNAT family N-acetyltransferase n=1 Tax=Massilia sp. W12 TaxID=3126507 RepID=UPI0030D2568D
MQPCLPEQIESERLLIRVARPGDGQIFNQAIHASAAKLAPWLGWVTPLPTLEQSEQNCRRAYARFLLQEDLMVFFLLKENGRLIGGSGLHKADWKLGIFEMGYWGHAEFGGAGLMSEGVRALSDHALQAMGANRVFLTTDEKNEASWRLAERAGFTLEGVLRLDRLDIQGRLRNTRVYARVSQRLGQTPE